jgi:hypothetical protein
MNTKWKWRTGTLMVSCGAFGATGLHYRYTADLTADYIGFPLSSLFMPFIFALIFFTALLSINGSLREFEKKWAYFIPIVALAYIPAGLFYIFAC